MKKIYNVFKKLKNNLYEIGAAGGGWLTGEAYLTYKISERLKLGVQCVLDWRVTKMADITYLKSVMPTFLDVLKSRVYNIGNEISNLLYGKPIEFTSLEKIYRVGPNLFTAMTGGDLPVFSCGKEVSSSLTPYKQHIEELRKLALGIGTPYHAEDASRVLPKEIIKYFTDKGITLGGNTGEPLMDMFFVQKVSLPLSNYVLQPTEHWLTCLLFTLAFLGGAIGLKYRKRIKKFFSRKPIVLS